MRAGRVWAFLAFAAVAASWPALLAQSASALEPGVHVDPGSPAAKEYALPVSQARGSGGGSEGAHEQLFGAGIKPPSSGSPGGGSRSATSRAHQETGRGAAGSSSGTIAAGATGATGAQSPPALVRRVADGQSSSGGGSSSLVLLGGGVAVIVLGAFAGIVLRHGRRPTSAA